MININIKSVNERFIFYTDDTSVKATHENLTAVWVFAKDNIVFYERMYREINEYVKNQDTVINNFNLGDEPQPRDLLKHIEWNQRRKQYSKECAVFKTYVDLQHDAIVKKNAWLSILNQTEKALILVKE